MAQEKGKSYDAGAIADARRAAQSLQDTRTGLVLTGRIRNGKLELDQSSVDQIAQRFPEADVSFVALNSPFDPESQSVV